MSNLSIAKSKKLDCFLYKTHKNLKSQNVLTFFLAEGIIKSKLYTSLMQIV